MSTLKIEHIANIANSGPDISIDTSGHLNIVNGSLQMGGTTMLDTSDTTLKNVSKIGIGTATPGYKLHLHENSSSESYQLFTNSTTGATTSDGFRIGIDSNENALIWHREAKNIQFATSNDTKMVILANGNVGIGTTSPSTKLHVDGGGSHVELRVAQNSTYYTDIGINHIDVAGNDLRIMMGGSEKWRFKSGGDLYASGVQEVKSGDKSSVGYEAFFGANSLRFNRDGDSYIDTRGTNNNLKFRHNSSYDVAMTILGSNGNVGIGVTDPDSALEVQSASGGNNSLHIANTSSTGYGAKFLGGGNTATRYIADFRNYSGVSKFKIDGDGNVGIGTSNPERPLHVKGANAFVRIESTSASQNSQLDIKSTAATWSIGQNQVLANTGTLEFYNGSSSPVVIKTNGNVGIGTTSPAELLHLKKSSGAPILRLEAPATELTRIELGDGSNYTHISSRPDMGDGLMFYENGATNTVMRGGKVGIGLTSPDAKLHVNGAAIVGSNTNQATTPIAGLHVIDNVYSHWSSTLSKQQVALRVETYWNASAGQRNTGKYGSGIGFNHLGGHSATHDENVHAWVGLRVEDTPSHERSNLVFATNNDVNDEDAGILERMCITPAGDVGINTKEPKEKLHVDGPSAYGGPKWGTWTETMTTVNGGNQTVRIVEDWSGRWILVGRWAANAATSVTGTWSSVRGLSTSTSQSETSAFSADFGESYPTECRFLGATDFTNYYNTRTIDFVHGIPVGRPWELFMSNGDATGMGQVTGTGSTKYGWTARGAYDGFGRWSNPNYQYHRVADVGNGGMIHSQAAFRTPTNNAFNWNATSDAKVSVDGTGLTYSGQDTDVTSMFGSDDAYDNKFGDSWPSRTSNSNFPGTQYTSAVWVLIKMAGI